MADNLVIVESPAKAKTIEKFLGKDYVVKSSFGHIRDLSKKDLGIDIEKDFSPTYEITADKKKVVTELRKSVKDAKTVWLASDEDREGEAIAWHLYEVLKLKPDNTKRIVFHEITKDAILKAIENPRQIDKQLVDAQQARRILDRLVGFELSPVLWKKVKPSLSAGRVQSVAVRIIVEREREIINFVPQSAFKVFADLSFINSNKNYNFRAVNESKIKSKDEAIKLLEFCKDDNFIVQNVEVKPSKKNPASPFTTSTLQQEASRKLGFSVSKTMTVAQRLYESGFITYMRTDSVNLSESAIENIKKQILSDFGDEYYTLRRYSSKIKGAQEAHESIRPTYFDKRKVTDNYDEQRLYDLIWKRTVASQMSSAIIEKTVVEISLEQNKEVVFLSKGEVIKFEGFLKVYKESFDDDIESEDNAVLPPLKVDDKLIKNEVVAQEKFTNYPSRYTEASLVKKLEDLGIGRPSTYAPTISTVQKRGYVIKEDRPGSERNYTLISLKDNQIKEFSKTETFGVEKSKMFPSDIGIVVTDFLIKYFDEILDYNFTANVEQEFDIIAEGKLPWNSMISKFYKPFHKSVEDTLEKSERGTGERLLGKDPETGKAVSVRIGKFGPIVQLGESEDDDKPKYASLAKGQLLETITLDEALVLLKHASDGRFLGIHPTSKKNITARIGRFGPFVQLGDSDSEEKPQYASLQKNQSIDTITLEEALELLKLPRALGEFEGKKVTANIGRFGPYIGHNSSFSPIKKGAYDPYSITLEEAIEVIKEKREKDANNTIKLFDEDKNIKVVLDRWKNPSVYYKRKYHRLGKEVDAKSLSLEDCYKIVGVDTKKKEKVSTPKSKKKK